MEEFKLGFQIPFEGPCTSFVACNLQSVKGLEGVVQDKISKELQKGQILGPFIAPPMLTLCISPLGVVPKKAAGKYQLIHHLSYPWGDSVNDSILDKLCTVCYTLFDQALRWCVVVVRGQSL